MGYLILDKQITVPFGGSVGTRTLLAGVNKDITQEMADHWYVRAAGGQYVEKLEDAHKRTPGAREAVTRARADWQQTVRGLMATTAIERAQRRDLVKLEKEFGVDTKAADKQFEDETQAEHDRLQALEDENAERIEVQAAADAGGALSPAQAERMAAGSEEVANTEMRGPAAAEAAASAGGVDPSQQLPRTVPDGAVGGTPTDVAAAGSAEAANTKPDGQPRVDDQKVDPKTAPKADVSEGGAKPADGAPKDPVKADDKSKAVDKK